MIKLSPEDEMKLIDMLTSDDDNFNHLSEIGGLDPATDFQHADLSEVDFSDSDLRGFNFTGADLTGTTGTNVTWDSTTILTDANISGSIFEVKP